MGRKRRAQPDDRFWPLGQNIPFLKLRACYDTGSFGKQSFNKAGPKAPCVSLLLCECRERLYTVSR
jgi:hypothetical protein